MAKKYHSTNQFCKRALALSLALATAIGSWSVDWNTLHVQAVGFDVQDEWRTTGEMITQEYTNTGTSYETITGVTLHMADMALGDVVSFAVSIEDADTGSVLSTASKDGVTAVGDVTISGLSATVAPNKKVFIYLTFGGDVKLYTDGSNYMEVATSAMENPPSSKVSIDEATTILTTDQTGQIVASEKAYGRAITYESNAPSVLTVDASGTIIPVGPGKATVTAKTSEAGDTPATIDVTVVQVSFGTTDLTYTGVAQAPSVTVEADKTLVAGVDYSVTGSATNVGESSAIVVEGKGDYAGFSASSAFSVSQTADIATASGGKYTIDTKTSDVTAVSNLKLSNGYELVYGTDFTATAERTGSDNSDGTYKHVYTVTLEGMGNFSGTKVETDIKVTADVTTPLSDVYTLEMTTADPLYAGQVDRDEVLHYVVIKNSKGKTVSKNGFTFTLSDENLNTPGTVTVTATYAELYDGEISTEFILYGSIGSTTATIEKSKWVYTGNPITPNVVVKSGTTTLKKDTDYTVSYSANTDVGEASIRIVGRGSYTGSKTVNFTIVPSVQDAVVTVGGNSTRAKKSNGFVSGYSVLYDGSVQEPSIQLSVGGYTLVKDDDFTVVYDNNTNASSQDNLAVATITTKADSACGTQVLNVYFTIEAVSVSGGTLTVDESSNVYTGEALELPVTLKVGTKTLVKDTDYTVEYSNNVDASAFAFVSVTGKGNYKDSLSKNFTIAKRSISGATITFKDAYSYTGSAVQPVPESVVVDGITLEKGVDYADAITYENNVKVGTAAKATIEGIGNFKGTASQTFTITPRSIIGPQITYAIAGSERVSEGDDGFVVTGEGSTKIATYASSYSAVYTGRANKPQIQVIDGDTTLKPATDYVVTYGSSVNAGTVTVVITGSGNYKNTGTIKITYTITPCALDDATRISVDASKFVPGTDSSVEIVDAKRKTTTSDGKLTLDTDYAVSWGDWNDKTEAGPNKVMTIAGKGNYTGTREVTYNQGIDIGAPESKGVLTIDDYIKGTYTENGTYQDAKKYDVYYLGGKSMEESLPRIQVAANQTGLKDGEYDLHFEPVKSNGYDAGSIVKVTATGKGTKYYGELTAYYEILPVTLDATNLKVKFDGDADYATAAGGKITKNYDYSGETITPAFTVTYMPINKINNKELPHPELVLGKDYTYEPPTINGSIGTTGKTGTIKGLGPNFVTTSSVEIEYTVGAANLNDAVISDIPAQEYKAGTPSDPTITVTYKGKTLVRGTDYTVNYNGTNETEGTATATITGIGNYTGEVTKQFEIVQKKLTKDTTTIVLKSSSKKYTGSALTLSSTGSEPEIIVRYNNQNLVEGTDYTLDYENNVNPGQAKITVKGAGDYGDDGTAVTNFDIYLDLADTDKYWIEGIPADKELVYYGENVWKQKSDTGVAFSANDLKIYTKDSSDVKHYLKVASAESYATLTSNLTQPTTGGTITINGAGANKYCVGSRTVDNIRVYIDASLLTVEGMANVYPYTGYEVKPGNTSTLRVLYGNRELTKGTEFTFEYKVLECSDLIKVDTGTTTNANVRAVYIQGNESRMFTGKSKDYPYSIKYDLSKATATGWKTTYTYTEIQNAATAAGTTVESYRPKPVMEFKDSTGTTVSIPTGSYSAEYASSMGDGAAFNSAGAIVNVIVGPLGTNSYCYNTKTLSYTITGIDTANHLDVELEANSFVYTGSKIEPNILNVRYNGTDLQSSDYTVQYANNVDVTTEASKAKVLVTGIGNYKGTTVVEFQITPKDIADTGSSVEPDFPRVVYTGKNIKAEELGGFVLRDTANGKVLKPGADQDFTFSVVSGMNAGTEAGKVSVTMNAGGNYKGTAEYKFDIDQLNLSDASLSVSKSEAEYTGQPIDIAIELTMKLNGASEAVKLDPNTMYEVTYNGQSSVVDIGTYDIVIQPKTGNDNVVGSNSATFTVTGRWIGTSDYQLYEDDNHKYTLTFDGVDYANPLEKNYTGDPVEPIVVLKDKDHNNNEPLVKDRDYTVTYKNNVDSTDSAEVIVEGIGNYYGIVKKTFAIGKNMGDGFGELSQPLDKVYNGAPQKQDGLKVLVDGKTLVENRDYKLSYSDDITNAGTVTVTATAIGTSGYYGTLSKTYQIKPKNIESETMVQIIPNLPKDANNSYYADYTGSKITPEVSVYVDNNGNDSFAESEKLTTDDYDVSYGDDTQNIKAGNGLIWVTFKRNYQPHTSERNFLIIGSELSEATTHVVVNDDYYTYTGSEIIPNLTVYQDLVTGRRVELSADDYTLELENNVNPGDATVTVKGRNSFSGSAKATFVIAADLSTIFTSDTTSGLDLDADGTLDNTCKVPKQLYTGAALTPVVDAVVGGKALRQNSDYMIGNVQLGTPDSEGNPTTGTVDITGNNKYYRGKYTASFEVTTDLSQIKLSYQGLDDVIYTGRAHKPNDFKVLDPSGNEVNYDITGVTYVSSTDGDDCINVGTVTVTIPITIGTVSSTVKTTYAIKPANIGAAEYTGGANCTYSGSPLQPPVVLYYYGEALQAGKDYEIVYDNNTLPTSKTSTGATPDPATITITGIGNFTGSYYQEFQIYPERMREVSAKPVGANGMLVSWDKLNHVSGYRVDVMSTRSNVPVKTVDVSNPSATSTTIAGLDEGTTYSFRAYSYVTVNDTTYYGLLNSITTSTGISTPQISTSSNKAKQATLTWRVGNSGAKYMIYRSDTANGEYKFIARTTTDATSFTDVGLTRGRTYYYKIRAYRYPNEYGEYSDVSAVTVK